MCVCLCVNPLTPEKMWETPLAISGELGAWREEGDMLRSTAGGVGVSVLSRGTTAAPVGGGGATHTPGQRTPALGGI